MKRTLSAILCAALCLVLALAGVARADVVKPNDDFYYYDDAGVMTDATRAMIYYNNVELQKACGAQIVVATVDSLNGEEISDYAYDLFSAWGIGSAEKNNGFLLLLSIGDDDYYALQGAGLTKQFSDSAISDLLYQYLEPDFAKKSYDAGVKSIGNF